MDLFGRNCSAGLNVGKALLNVWLRPRQVHGVQTLLLKSILGNEGFHRFFDRLEAAFGDLGFEPLLGVGLQTEIHVVLSCRR